MERQSQGGISRPFLETLTGVPNNKLKPTPPPFLSPPFGGCEGRSSHCALNTHSAQINAHTHTHTHTPDAVVARGAKLMSDPPPSLLFVIGHLRPLPAGFSRPFRGFGDWRR